MSLMHEIRTKLNFIGEKLVRSPEKLSDEERLHHLAMLREIVQTARAIEESLNKVTEGATLRLVGMFPFNADRSFMLPTKEGVQYGILLMQPAPRSLNVEVECISTEKNFNFLKYSTISQNHLLEEEEVYVKFKTPEQASYVLGMTGNLRVAFDLFGRTESRVFQFSTPSQKQSTRVIYRSIGVQLKRMKVIDDRLKDIGAVPGRGGIPVLRADLVDSEEFDETVTTLLENMREQEQPLSVRRSSDLTGKEELHGYLVSKIKVDKKKRQMELDGLVRERIEILLKLSSFDPDEIPFAFDREFH